ncbi:hypothetical protein Ddye_028091 [Dipteronia dyeriana]|uniref:Uncharacterized protein n=1 Tax=Dipteronia dyeriana TaxID=168575 RepID=A0AAD9TR08_9ROSI|nr:hypothetical protein Ddye_028091 [Dipteronia dyeriana]
MFVNILRSRFRSADLKKQATWALENVACGSVKARNNVLSNGALKPIIALIDILVNSSMLRAAVKTLSIFWCIKPSPSFEQATWALGNVAGDSGEARNSVLSDCALKPIKALTDIEATWAWGNVTGDTSEARNSILSDGALKPIKALTDIEIIDIPLMVDEFLYCTSSLESATRLRKLLSIGMNMDPYIC